MDFNTTSMDSTNCKIVRVQKPIQQTPPNPDRIQTDLNKSRTDFDKPQINPNGFRHTRNVPQRIQNERTSTNPAIRCGAWLHVHKNVPKTDMPNRRAAESNARCDPRAAESIRFNRAFDPAALGSHRAFDSAAFGTHRAFDSAVLGSPRAGDSTKRPM